jgi:hypothetical protein
MMNDHIKRILEAAKAEDFKELGKTSKACLAPDRITSCFHSVHRIKEVSNIHRNCSVPLFEKEGLGEIF